MGLEVIPETAKALAEPVTKLIEVVAAGFGRLYDPTHIRNKARAEGDALVIMAEAEARASALSVRAARRLLDQAERRQANVEGIAARAMDLLPNAVSPEPVDSDWSARFFAECQDVSNQELQTVWAKLLAGEVTQPGTFSQRTLQLLRNLSAREAQLFNALCKGSFRGVGRAVVHPMLFVREQGPFWQQFGLNFETLHQLVSAGLVAYHETGVLLDGARSVVFRWGGKAIFLRSELPLQLPLGDVSLTPSGCELAGLCEWDVPEAQVELLKARATAQGYSVQEVVVTAVTETEVTGIPTEVFAEKT